MDPEEDLRFLCRSGRKNDSRYKPEIPSRPLVSSFQTCFLSPKTANFLTILTTADEAQRSKDLRQKTLGQVSVSGKETSARSQVQAGAGVSPAAGTRTSCTADVKGDAS